MTAHFSDDYQLEAIRSDLHKVLGAVSELLPPKPGLAEPTLFDAPKLSNEHYYSGGHGINRKPRPVEPFVDARADAMKKFNSMYPISAFDALKLVRMNSEPEPCAMTAAPVDPLINSLRAEIAQLRETLTGSQDRYTDTEMARRRLLEDNRVMRIELCITASERDVLARKLAEIHATAAPRLTSKLTPVELP